MGNVYMVRRRLDGRSLPKEWRGRMEAVALTNERGKTVFSVMRKVYRLLDDWKSRHSDTPLLLAVDPETARIVHSYFCEMSDKEYERFSISEGEVRQYRY